MKVIINNCFGGFSISDELERRLNLEGVWYDEDDIRTNPVAIAAVEENSNKASGCCANLRVVEVPDEATDYMVTEYDGAETLYYVLDGKIHSCWEQ